MIGFAKEVGILPWKMACGVGYDPLISTLDCIVVQLDTVQGEH